MTLKHPQSVVFFIPHTRSKSITRQNFLDLTTTTELSKNGNQGTAREMSAPRGFRRGMIT
jgi:hypothetical protein